MLETTPLSVVRKLSDRQAQVLLLEPLRAIAQYAPEVVVIIDGIDELAKAAPSILSKVTSVLCSITFDLPTNVKILIFSQPEQTWWCGPLLRVAYTSPLPSLFVIILFECTIFHGTNFEPTTASISA